MISCSKCSFKIKKNMQYCLKNNMCPSCGSSIMNNSDIKVSKLIANKLIDAGFSENIFELSIFIMENFTKPDSVESNKEVVTEDIAIEEDSSKLTSGTNISSTFLFGKFVGKDSFGNKYYKSRSDKRWVIYKGEVDASKIPNEWYSWMHFTNNKIENIHDLKKYDWQKPHKSNQTGTENSYHPNKNNNEFHKKYKSWKS